jgi:hypothetical protein
MSKEVVLPQKRTDCVLAFPLSWTKVSYRRRQMNCIQMTTKILRRVEYARTIGALVIEWGWTWTLALRRPGTALTDTTIGQSTLLGKTYWRVVG